MWLCLCIGGVSENALFVCALANGSTCLAGWAQCVCTCRLGLGTFASSGSVLSLWPVVYGCIDICESLCVSGSLPASCPNRALNATLLPECAEECGGHGERGAHVLGCRPAGCGKLLRPGGRGCGQAKPAWSQALQLLPSSTPPTPFSARLGTC